MLNVRTHARTHGSGTALGVQRSIPTRVHIGWAAWYSTSVLERAIAQVQQDLDERQQRQLTSVPAFIPLTRAVVSYIEASIQRGEFDLYFQVVSS